jgi:hypothetical protein
MHIIRSSHCHNRQCATLLGQIKQLLDIIDFPSDFERRRNLHDQGARRLTMHDGSLCQSSCRDARATPAEECLRRRRRPADAASLGAKTSIGPTLTERKQGDTIGRRATPVGRDPCRRHGRRLVGAEEEGTLAWRKRLRDGLIAPAVSEHRGGIVKFTGDGLLAEFLRAVGAVRYVTRATGRNPWRSGRCARRAPARCRPRCRHRCRPRPESRSRRRRRCA